MPVIDTSILVYATYKDCGECEKSRNVLRRFVEGAEPWHLTWQNIFEFLRMVTDPKSPKRTPVYIDEGLALVQKLLQVPSLQILQPGPRHFEVFNDIVTHTPGIRGNLIHDARLVSVMVENGVREIYTPDTGFRRFKDIEVINPFV